MVMAKRRLSLILLTVFFVGAISFCPCSAQSFMGLKGNVSKVHSCCDKAGKCPMKGCQNESMISLLPISEKVSREVLPNAPIIVRAVLKSQDQSRPVKTIQVPPDFVGQIPSPDIPIAFSTLLI